MEYQKEANRLLSDLYGKKVEVEQRRAQIGSLIFITLVEWGPEHRSALA